MLKIISFAFATLLLSNSISARDLSEAQAQLLVREIDNICGDTWCEGEFNFSFETLSCEFEKGVCEFHFVVLDILYDDDWNEVGEIQTKALCTIAATSRDELFDETGSSYSYYLYETMTECISEAEEVAWARRV